MEFTSIILSTLLLNSELCSQKSNFESVKILELNSKLFFSQLSFLPPHGGENETWQLFSLLAKLLGGSVLFAADVK